MISVNLLPDSKLEHLQSQRKQRTLGTLSTVAIAIGVGLPILLIALWGGQKALRGIIQGNINKKSEELQQVEGLSDILTAQHQIDTLPDLEKQRLYYTTLTGILPKLLPANASLSSISLDQTGALNMTGTADSVATINNLISIFDSTVSVDGSNTETKLFNNVSLLQIQPTDTGGSFEVTATFDPLLLQKVLTGEIRVGEIVVVPRADAGQPTTPSEPDSDQSEEGILQGEAEL